MSVLGNLGIIFNFYLFYLCLCWVFVAMHGLSLVVCELLIGVLLLWSTGCGVRGLQ